MTPPGILADAKVRRASARRASRRSSRSTSSGSDVAHDDAVSQVRASPHRARTRESCGIVSTLGVWVNTVAASLPAAISLLACEKIWARRGSISPDGGKSRPMAEVYERQTCARWIARYRRFGKPRDATGAVLCDEFHLDPHGAR